tara:strand:+ start:496 stop:867 length:372 start_codon:yes stop_codon:yes gene_type:complete
MSDEMGFQEWMWLDESMTETPRKIAELERLELDDMTVPQILLLAKWHGVRPSRDIERLKDRIRRSRVRVRSDRYDPNPDPTPEEVRKRIRAVLMRQGSAPAPEGSKQRRVWLPRRNRNLFGEL